MTETYLAGNKALMATELPPPGPSGPVPPTGRRINLRGMEIDCVTEQAAVDFIVNAISVGRGGWVITPNLDQLRQFCQQPALRAMYGQADLVLPDGMPLVWASRLQRTPLVQRVPGSSVIFTLTQAAAQHQFSIFLLGGKPGAAETAAKKLLEGCPGIRIAGTLCPPMGFEQDPAQMTAIRNALTAAQPDIVYVGLGFPKQERLIMQMRTAAPAAWFLGVGISISFVAGDVARAPAWMQRAGLEWLHRMIQEPGRLLRRYAVDDLPFALRLLGACAVRGCSVGARKNAGP